MSLPPSRRSLGLAIAVVCCLSGAQAQAADLSAGVLVRDHALSPAEAAKQLDIQTRATDLSESASAAAGAAFASMWFDASDGGRVHIGLAQAKASPDAADKLDALLSQRGLSDDAVIVPMRNSWADLVAAQAVIDRSLADAISAGHASTGIDTAANAVAITTAAGLSAQEDDLVTNAARASAVRVEITRSDSPSLGLTAFACSVPYCDRPLRGGVRITSPAGGCTAGFNVASRSDGKLFALTAGHCAEATAGTWQSQNSVGTIGDIGIRHSWFHGISGDAGIVRNWMAFWVGPPAPVAALVVPDSAFTTFDGDYGIGGVATAGTGQAVCATSGTLMLDGGFADCGSVQGVNRTVPVSGVTVGGLTETNLCGAPGSSGGPVYKNNKAFGTIVGGSTVVCDTFFQNVVPATDMLNVNVLTR